KGVARHTRHRSWFRLPTLERPPAGRRRATSHLLARLRFLHTTQEAATRAGRYQREWQKGGHTIHTPDALVAGTARAHGASILTDTVEHFPMRDIRIIAPPRSRGKSRAS